MKRYVKNENIIEIPQHIFVVVDIEVPEAKSKSIASASYKGFQIPDGPLLSGIPKAIADSQALADYAAFIESVQGLITDYYELTIYYKNQSKDNSHYFGILAKDSEGNVILDFDFHLRVSNHPAHRSGQSQANKREQKEALLKLTDGKKLKPIVKHILVNKEEFENYTQAYMYIDSVIEETVEVMKRRSE